METLDVVREAVGVVLEIDPATLDADTTFAALKADSLVLVGVADEVEARVGTASGLHIDDGTLAGVTTLGQLAEYVTRQVGR